MKKYIPDKKNDIKQTLKFMEEIKLNKYGITSGIRRKPQKVVIYGPSGIGKTTLAAQAPKPVFIDTEDSSMQLNVSRYPKPQNWEELLDMAMSVCETDYQTLIIDTADWAEKYCSQHICKKAGKTGIEDFGYGKGYAYLEEEFKKLLDTLDVVISNGINVILVAHAMMRKFEQPDELGAYDRWELKLSKKVSPLVKEWSDALLFCNYKTTVVKTDSGSNKVQGGKRIVYASHNPCWDAKNRHGLKDEFPMEYSEIANIFYTEDRTPSTPTVNAATSDLGLPFDVLDTFVDDFEGVEPELVKAMKSRGITISQLQSVVAQKGWESVNTHPKDYPAPLVSSLIKNIDKIKTQLSLGGK